MKVIIAGSREFNNVAYMERCLKLSRLKITEVVCGEAAGADTLGKEWAERNGIPVKSFPADWKTHGKAAGPIRNMAMARYAEGLIAFPLGESRGTRDMIRRATALGLKVLSYEDSEQ